MKNFTRLFAALLSILAVVACFGFYFKDLAEAATRPQSQKSGNTTQHPALSMGSLPGSNESLYGPSFASLAWGLFLEAMTPTNGSLTFETWTEQCQLNPNAVGCPSAATVAAAAKIAGNGKLRLLHGGATARTKKIAGTDCGGLITTPVGGYPAPSNLAKKAMFCEEIYMSPPEAAFVKEAGLTTLVGQQTYGKARSRVINFPGTELNMIREELDSVEIKVDWVPASSYKPTFACPDLTNHLYTETINGTCYAMVAIHISSKVMPQWLWATFEPNSKITNPNRCDPMLYGACFDPWGTTSSEPYEKGQTVHQSPELREAMSAANLNPAFRNYFLTGVQTQFVDDYGTPIQLGNSFVEFNQGVPPGKSSCITCHQYAHFDGKQPPRGAPQNNFGGPLRGWPSIGYACNKNQDGNCIPEDSDSTSQDFSWMLALMPYNDAGSKKPAPQSQPMPKLAMH